MDKMYGWLFLCMAMILVNVFTLRKNRAAKARFLAQCAGGNCDAIISDAVKDLLRDGQRIQALKQFRVETGLGLKDAREILDAMAAGASQVAGGNASRNVRQP